jgi:hypothetical protein
MVDDLRENGPANLHSNIVKSTEIAFSPNVFLFGFQIVPDDKPDNWSGYNILRTPIRI